MIKSHKVSSKISIIINVTIQTNNSKFKNNNHNSRIEIIEKEEMDKKIMKHHR